MDAGTLDLSNLELIALFRERYLEERSIDDDDRERERCIGLEIIARLISTSCPDARPGKRRDGLHCPVKTIDTPLPHLEEGLPATMRKAVHGTKLKMCGQLG
jgi:hypothetical protein